MNNLEKNSNVRPSSNRRLVQKNRTIRSLEVGFHGSPERVVRPCELGDLQVAHLEIAHIVHGDLELHGYGADLRSQESHRSTNHK